MIDLDHKAWRTPLTHPAFRDVYFYLIKKFYVKEKKIWKLKVAWMHVNGYEIAKGKLQVTTAKMKEFIKYDESEQRRRAVQGNGRTLEVPDGHAGSGNVYDTFRVEDV